jgi:NAD+ kinase
MKYAIYHKPNRKEAIELAKRIEAAIDSRHTRDDINPDYVIVIGGDGTFLSAVHQYIDKTREITFINFRRGNTAFYLNFDDEDVVHINELLDGKCDVVNTLPLLKAHVGDKKYYALNEFTLGTFMKASGFNIYINDYFLQTTYGNGLLVCTPYGSSGYNKSLGGALLAPNTDTFELTEMASIQSKKYKSLGNSLVLRRDSTIHIHYIDTHPITLTFDNKFANVELGQIIDIKYSKKIIKVFSKEGCTFFDKLKAAF